MPDAADSQKPSESAPLVDDLNNPATDKAVNDIMASDSDAVLEAEDETKLSEAFSGKKPSLKDKIRRFLKDGWGNPRYRWLTLIALGALLFIVLAVPPSRYFLLNTAGVRASASLTVLDEKTLQPLKNVTVSLASQSGKTDNDGKVKLAHLKLGSSKLVIERRAFAKIEKTFTVGWGSNPLGDFRLTPTGSQYVFKVTDFLSDKPIAKAEAVSDEFSALADEQGKIVLTIDKTSDQDIKVSLNADTYRSQQLTLSSDQHNEQSVKLVPDRKEVFVSKRSGKLDVYKVDVDGQNEEKLLSGTGFEHEDGLALSVHPTDEVAAYVSTRDNKRNQDGFVLSQLYLIDINTGTPTLVDSSELIQIIDWSQDRLVYVKVAQGASAANPQRHRLIAYNYKTGQSKELASANYFNDVLAVDGTIYYAPSAAYQADSNRGLFKINADGTSKQTIINQEVWNILRLQYDHLNIALASGDWFDYRLGGGAPSKMSGPPSPLRSRLYLNNPADSLSLWVDERDGKGVLLAYDISAKTDKVLKSQSGLKNPIRWLNNHYVIFRVNSGQETADYVMNLDGGDARKIRDVTNTSGLDAWYYY